jgi:hypothetical protein
MPGLKVRWAARDGGAGFVGPGAGTLLYHSDAANPVVLFPNGEQAELEADGRLVIEVQCPDCEGWLADWRWGIEQRHHGCPAA